MILGNVTCLLAQALQLGLFLLLEVLEIVFVLKILLSSIIQRRDLIRNSQSNLADVFLPHGSVLWKSPDLTI